MPILRKKTRLPSENYVGIRAHFVTICCDLKHTYLAETQVATRVVFLLQECAAGRSFLLHAYCLMPDHLHLLAEGTQPDSDLLEFMRVFKLRTAFEFRQSHGRPLWEMSYYDHILRSSDSIEGVACYIWWNPVRKRLCSSPQEYPFSGSQTIQWMQCASRCPSWSAPWTGTGPI
jgi:putative transposase